MKIDLPVFPKFEKLSLNHKEILQAIVNNFPSSDFNFAGLFTWDVGDLITVSSLYGNLVIRSADYITHEIFYSFIGDKKVDKTIETILDYAESENESTTLKLIPETVAKCIKQKDFFKVVEDPDNHDYIYYVNDWVELKGKKFEKKRSIAKSFANKYGKNIKQGELDLNNKKVRKDIINVIEMWRISRNKSHNDIIDELKAIQKALDHHQILNMRAFGIYIDKLLIAFNLFEILPGKMAISHFHKGDVNYIGVFEHLTHNFAKHLMGLDVITYNFEQDLGIPGLRQSKMSFHPSHFIKKYTVERIE